MRGHASLSRVLQLTFVLAFFCVLACASAAQDTSWQTELAAWRTQHAQELQKPDGWLALAGLKWLDAGDNSFGSSPDNKIRLPAGGPDHMGILRLTGTTVTLAPSPDGFPQGFLIDGKPAQAGELHTDPDHDKNNPRMTIGGLNVYVVHRGERFALCIKDAKSPTLTGFRGLRSGTSRTRRIASPPIGGRTCRRNPPH